MLNKLLRRRGLMIGAAGLAASAAVPSLLFAQQNTLRIDFESMEEKAPPAGFSMAMTGQGGPPLWIVQREEGTGGKVLTQTSADATNYRFPLCIVRDFTARDLELSVRFKPISGRRDQAAGLVWRLQSDANYYVVRANALENNVVMYKMENGKRVDLKPIGAGSGAYGKEAPVRRKEWNDLSVTARGTKFNVSLNGTQLFDVEDGTFQQQGRVGLWTKADSVSSFDDLSATSFD